EPRLYVDERITDRAGEEGDRVFSGIEPVGVVGLAGPDANDTFKKLRIKLLQSRLNAYLAESVKRALIDRIGHNEVLAVRGHFRDGRDYRKIGIAILQIELTKLLAVIGDAVGIVVIVRA